MTEKKRLFSFAFFVLISLLFFPLEAEAILELSVEGSNLDFGYMEVGEEKELLDEGSYHQQISAKSTNDRTWYLEVYYLDPLSSPRYSIAGEYFSWSVVWSDGKGNLVNEHRFVPFTTTPSLVYISQGDENSSGNEVKFRFRYRLRIPVNQPMGSYYTSIRFNLVEPL